MGTNTAASMSAIAISRTADLFHSFHRGVLRVESRGHIQFHCFHHDNRIVNHQADGQDQAEKRE